MSEVIRLTPYEISLAAQVGCMRVTESLRLNQSWGHGYREPVYFKFAKSISGACAEFAVAQYLKIPPQIHVNHGAKADIKVNGTEIQVKSHLHKDDRPPLLYIRQNAQPGELFCFVTDKSPEFHILGFIMAKDIIFDDSRLTDFGNKRPQVYQLKLSELKPLNKIV
jgi:hypothetical protein